MLEPIEIKGYWWLPDDPDNQLPGTLTYSQEEGAVLDLVGVYGMENSKRIEQPRIILGTQQNGKSITLHRCHIRSSINFFPGMGQANYYAHLVFDGVHFETEEDIRFSELQGNYTDLDAWINTFGFDLHHNYEGGNYDAEIKYTKPESRGYTIGNGFEVGVWFSCSGPGWSRIQTEAKITQQAFLFVKNKDCDVPFEDLFQLLNRFSYMHQMAIRRINYPQKIVGFTKVNEVSRETKDGIKKEYPEVNIYYSPVEAYTKRKELYPIEMLFTFKDLDEENIKNWFENFDKFQNVIHLYRSLFYSKRLFIDTRFLNIAQALESLHSILFDNNYLPKKEFKAKKEKVLESVPEDLRDWVNGALGSANYKRFREKILELIEDKSPYLRELVPDHEEFAQKIRDTRNEFVHQNEQKHTIRDKRELSSAIMLLTILFELYALEIIGFPEAKIQKMFVLMKHNYLSWIQL